MKKYKISLASEFFLALSLLSACSSLSASELPRKDFLAAAAPLFYGNSAKAFESLEPLALAGNAHAAVAMSRYYREAYYAPSEVEKACNFASIAADQGDPEGAFELAMCLQNRGADAQSAEVVRHLQFALNQGSLRAKTQQSCGYHAIEHQNPEKNRWELRSSELNALDPLAKLEFAKFKYYACGEMENIQNAREIIHSIDLPRFGAANHLSGLISYYLGEESTSRTEFSEALKSGHHGSIRNLYFLLAGTNASADNVPLPAKPHLFRTVASWAKNPGASCLIFHVYRLGVPLVGLEKDDDLAFQHAENCALKGHQVLNATALNWLAIMYDFGLGTKRNERKALELYSLAYESGDPYAAMNMGETYEEGKGVEVDYEVALNWYRRSIEAFGDDVERSKPIIDVGRMYESGLGVEQNYEKAALLYREAISINPDANPIVYIRLADLIRLGFIDGDLDEAETLYAKATNNFPLYESLVVGEQEKAYKAIAKSKLANLERAKRQDTKPEKSNLNAGNFYALLFGANDYKALNDLATPIQDTRDIAELLRRKYGFDTTLIENPSRRDILGSLSKLRKTLGPQDNLLIYFAGHGVLDAELNLGFWQPIEAEPDTDLDWIPTDRITRSLRGFSSSNILVIADSCYSAAILRGNAALQANATDAATLQSLIETKTRVALTSGGLSPVADSATGAKNSVFAGALKTVLGSENRPITATEVFSRVRGRVASINASLGFDQSPEFSSLLQSGHEGGDFVFVPKKLEEQNL